VFAEVSACTFMQLLQARQKAAVLSGNFVDLTMDDEKVCAGHRHWLPVAVAYVQWLRLENWKVRFICCCR
jgi:hypothetical protein